MQRAISICSMLISLIVLISVATAQVPLSDGMAASGVLGASDFTTNTNYASPSTTTLAEPTSVSIDPTSGKMFVSDRDNRRVLRWSSANKLVDGSAAEAVFGQPDFVTRTANTGGLSDATTNNPNSVCVDASGRLWVADMSNNRVLRFDNASSISSAASANGVLGQPDFTTSSSGLTAAKMNTPTCVYVDASGTLWVADRANNRVLRFDNAASKSNGANADGVLGQADFVTATTGLTASTMNTPWGVFMDAGSHLWVADRINNRVLRFDNAAAKSNGGNADGVLGEPDFTTSVYNKTQSGLGEPRGVAVDGLGRLFVADEGNTRIMVYNNAAGLANGSSANNVLGQTDFTSDNSSPITASSLNYPISLFIDNSNDHIWVPDIYDHRILRYDVSPLPVELTSFTASVNSGKVELHWATATEVNNAGFVVEKQIGNDWSKIGYVEGNGTSSSPKSYTYTDNSIPGKYYYRLKQVDRDGNFKYSNTIETTVDALIKSFSLGQNYPNPFNPTTNIQIDVVGNEHITIEVFNTLGQRIALLLNNEMAEGHYTIPFDASSLSAGIYLYRLQAGNIVMTKKMMLVK